MLNFFYVDIKIKYKRVTQMHKVNPFLIIRPSEVTAVRSNLNYVVYIYSYHILISLCIV